jgi:hypothetical protein
VVIRDLLFLAITLGALVAVLAWRRPRQRPDDEIRAVEGWLESFSVDSYRPMLRLADHRDTSFLGAHRGADEAARYSRLQRRILKEYLQGLSRDFHRLHLLAADTAVGARGDRGNSLTLVEEKMEFILSMWSIEFNLLFSEIAPRVINLEPVLAQVDQLAARTREVSRRRLQFRVS